MALVRARWMAAVLHTALLLGLLGSNVGQRVAFKCLGYSLAPYPYFILLVVSGSFVVIFGAICAGILVVTGGWLPESRTWKTQAGFWAVGVCNAFQGLGMVVANPYVSGYLQALLQQAVIPFTLATSALALGARFGGRQYAGVALIVGGLAVQLALPQGASETSAASGGGGGEVGHSGYALVFLLSQLPVAFGAVLQELAFQDVAVNVFQMMFWASAAQFATLVALAPLGVDSVGYGSRLDALTLHMEQAFAVAEAGGAGGTLMACVVAMLLAQLLQALVVKYSSAAFAVLCIALVLPVSAVAFTQTVLVGAAHTERITGTTLLSLVLVFAGVLCYRFGDGSAQKAAVDLASPGGGRAAAAAAQPLLAAAAQPPPSLAASCGPSGATPPPRMCSGGVGIISSEYSNSRHSAAKIWEEGTLRERLESVDELIAP